MSDFWKRRAHSPNVSPNKRDKAKFVLKGDTQQLTQLWQSIKKETKSGHLGYFSNFSDDSQIIIVFFGNALNNSSKKKIQNKIFDLILNDGLDEVSVSYRTEDDDTPQLITDRRSDRIYVPESSQESQYDYQSNDESDTPSDDETQEELSETDSSDIESDKSDSHSEDDSDGDTDEDNEVVTDSNDDSNGSNSESGVLIKVIEKHYFYKKPKTLKRKKSPKEDKMLTRSMANKYGKRVKIHDFRRNLKF